ncbi:MAG: bis(5'-nucleosyl)-tetraphosphatase (symmetrical) YqeK [Acholeplasmatales bacterium]|nr:bis(5'-nucleosyl)-tetraphosphatase (symmetrical) YqeK [Acholeplasmatales bacterium]
MQSLDKARNLVLEKYKNEHQSRLQHILGVVKMAKYLAGIYGVDETKAQIAAYMHDYIKYESIDEMLMLINEEDKDECMNCNVLLHSYASANMYLKYIGNDMDIYNAIRNHVFGRTNMSKLEEIILISDYTEENRQYESCITCRKILLAGKLDEAIYYSTKKTVDYLESTNKKAHPTQIAVLKEYEGKILL